MTTNRRFLIIVGCAALLIIAYVSLYCVPGVHAVSALRKQKAVLAKKFGEIDRELEEQKRTSARNVFLKERLRTLQERFTDDNELSPFLEYLSTVAADTAIQVTQMTPLAEKEIEEYNVVEVPILISAKGSYHQLGHFINQLELGPRFTLVQELRISPDQKDIFLHHIEILVTMFIINEL
ncbi:MAG: type 4a pilus biogenesis protein PilO [Candidatus Omnitrophica bacterium]|nr:type 4a pilus biogenesis protein PilO [Candidatus Omnitrophota bacterium]